MLPESGSPPGEVEEKPAGSPAATEEQVSDLFLQLCTWSDFWAVNFHHLLQTSSVLPSPETHLLQVRPETPPSGVSPAQLVLLGSPVSGWHCAHHRSQASSDCIWSQGDSTQKGGFGPHRICSISKGKMRRGLSTHTPCKGALTAGTSRKVSGKENSPPSCSWWK